MFRFFIGVIIFCFFSCKLDKSKIQNEQDNSKKAISITADLKKIIRFNSFDTTVEVLFWDTKDSINNIQKKNYDGFVANQDSLTPEILKKIFEFYKDSYSVYKEAGHRQVI